MNDLKTRAFNGLSWSFIETFMKYGITFVSSIILARILSPSDFGLIGMTSFFVVISQTFIDSGFSQAIIREQNVSDVDYSSVFFFNLFLGFAFFTILFFSSTIISLFFNEPRLEIIIKVISSTLIIGSFSVVQRAKFTKELNLKGLAYISLFSTIISGIISIVLALTGFGVWSLVAGNVFNITVTSVLLFIYSTWKPRFQFSIASLKRMFSFGSKLMITALINTTFNNVFLLVIGKYFSADSLGYYVRADNFQKIASQNITTVIQRVSFPVLAELQNDNIMLRKVYVRLIRNVMFITFCLLFGIIGSADQLIVGLIGAKWQPSIIYLQLLSVVGMFYPLHAINLNVLNVKGRSDIFLKLEIIKKLLIIPVIILGVINGIRIMIIMLIAHSIVSYYLNSYWTGKIIRYGITNQLKDILPSFLFALGLCGFLFLIGQYLLLKPIVVFIIQVFAGFLFIVIIGELIKQEEYSYIKGLIYKQLLKR